MDTKSTENYKYIVETYPPADPGVAYFRVPVNDEGKPYGKYDVWDRYTQAWKRTGDWHNFAWYEEAIDGKWKDEFISYEEMMLNIL